MLLRLLEKLYDPINSGKDEYLVQCAFHDDDKPSLSVNTGKKLFNCHACGEKGSIPRLFAKTTGYSEDIVRYELNWLAATLKWELPDFQPAVYHKRLLNHKELLQHLHENRHWSLETIEELQLGWDGTRITIPVFNIFGDIVNVRKYKPKAGPDEYKVINIKGYGKARLYNIRSLRNAGEVLLLEGEPDVIAAHSLGLPAISGTAGAKRFGNDWPVLFRNREVLVCYDNDEAGGVGSQRAAQLLSRDTESTKRVDLPEAGQDFTDFIHSSKTPRESFQTLVSEAKVFVVEAGMETSTGESSAHREIFETSLSESSEQRYYRKLVRLRVMVSGKTLSPYIVPKNVKVSCSLPDLKMCAGCDLAFKGGKSNLSFTRDTIELLQLVESPLDSHQRIFKELCGIPTRCKICKFDIKEAQNVEEVKVIPNLDFSDDDSQYVIRQVYYMGHGLKANCAYEIVGLTIPHPKTQQVTYLSDDVTPLEDTISAFKVDDELIERLRLFSLNGTDSKETE